MRFKLGEKSRLKDQLFKIDFGIQLSQDKNAYMFSDIIDCEYPYKYGKTVLEENTDKLKYNYKYSNEKYDCYMFNSNGNIFWIKIRKINRLI